MPSRVHELPDSIVLFREEYRLQHAALEAALRVLLRRIWPFLDELDDAE